jgi:hypothetical protein
LTFICASDALLCRIDSDPAHFGAPPPLLIEGLLRALLKHRRLALALRLLQHEHVRKMNLCAKLLHHLASGDDDDVAGEDESAGPLADEVNRLLVQMFQLHGANLLDSIAGLLRCFSFCLGKMCQLHHRILFLAASRHFWLHRVNLLDSIAGGQVLALFLLLLCKICQLCIAFCLVACVRRTIAQVVVLGVGCLCKFVSCTVS